MGNVCERRARARPRFQLEDGAFGGGGLTSDNAALEGSESGLSRRTAPLSRPNGEELTPEEEEKVLAERLLSTRRKLEDSEEENRQLAERLANAEAKLRASKEDSRVL